MLTYKDAYTRFDLLITTFPEAIFSFTNVRNFYSFPGDVVNVSITQNGLKQGDTIRGRGYTHIAAVFTSDIVTFQDRLFQTSLCMVKGGGKKHLEMAEQILNMMKTIDILLI